MLKTTIQDSQDTPKGCVIWMHGLGADASDMQGLAAEMPISGLPLRHVFLDAPVRPVTINGGMAMPAWYDITGFSLTDREDHAGIEASRQGIDAVMNAQIKAGFAMERIFLAGFSQGGAMALHTALHCKGKLAGVMALSAYLPVRHETKPSLSPDTPFFVGYGELDDIVLPLWTNASLDWLHEHRYGHVSAKHYMMGHSICHEEMADMARWMNEKVVEWSK